MNQRLPGHVVRGLRGQVDRLAKSAADERLITELGKSFKTRQLFTTLRPGEIGNQVRQIEATSPDESLTKRCGWALKRWNGAMLRRDRERRAPDLDDMRTAGR